jgi:RNA polymerase sigma-70 factor (ECF subfamily)
MPETIEVLLERLAGGEEEAAAELFRAYEPYLRIVVRRQLPDRLRRRFDSTDVVQSVWADVLVAFRRNDCHFEDAAHLQAYLVRAARNRFVDRYRQHQRSVDRECPLVSENPEIGLQARQDRPSQVAHAGDLWQQLLAISDPEHHELLRLKRDGFSVAEIAERTGFHADSVHRILRQLARQLAERGGVEPGE